eukprot:TRINITY_DN137_c0_g1_i4.p1 TRINITY_DN137_c0_g1~~TRINITY_DN137_c0_g1_i4.p1  ORF type:complete len:172 (-),score=50.48 TRINITY_DN137_c0_g1_i4:137-652(-)
MATPEQAADSGAKRKILIAVDQSEESTHSLKWALENVIQPGDKVHLLHAQPYPAIYAGSAGPAGFYVPPDVIDSLKKQEEQISRQVLRDAKALCDEKKIDVEADVIVGEPRESICDAVDQLGADLLVMGSHGYGAIKRALIGSVSDFCVHHAKCPVVVVRKPATAAAAPSS